MGLSLICLSKKRFQSCRAQRWRTNKYVRLVRLRNTPGGNCVMLLPLKSLKSICLQHHSETQPTPKQQLQACAVAEQLGRQGRQIICKEQTAHIDYPRNVSNSAECAFTNSCCIFLRPANTPGGSADKWFPNMYLNGLSILMIMQAKALVFNQCTALKRHIRPMAHTMIGCLWAPWIHCREAL